jgi:hypothetical protein
MGIDNILKPIPIAKSGKLPVLVLFPGNWRHGNLGFTGMFKGAYGCFHTILNSWLGNSRLVQIRFTCFIILLARVVFIYSGQDFYVHSDQTAFGQ